jgi:hypothetical protein
MYYSMSTPDFTFVGPINGLRAPIHAIPHFGKACFGQLRGLQLATLLN